MEDEKGNIMLGGCEVYDDMPEFYCKDCDSQWNSNDVKKEKYKAIEAFLFTLSQESNSGHLRVNLDFSTGQMTYNEWGSSMYSPLYNKQISAEQLDRIREILTDVDLLKWPKKLINFAVIDGISWSLEVTVKGV